MLLVVVAHAALAYVELRIPRLLWAVRDPARSWVFDALFWASVSVAMPAFFCLSGLFAAKIIAERGPGGFARDRARRIGMPFLAALVTVLPLSLVAWSAGWLRSGRCTWPQLRNMRFLDPVIRSELIGPAHLWYLEYLIVLLALFGLARRWRRRGSGLEVGGGWLLHPLAPLAAAVPTALILWAGHARLGVDGVADLRNSFLPAPFRWAHHAWFFLVGTWLHGHRDRLDRLARQWWWRLGLCVPVFVVRFGLLQRDLQTPLQGAESGALAAAGALFGWLALFGSIGLFQRLLNRPRPAVRYVADASYWIYLVHFPIVGLLQVDLARSPLPGGLKFAIVLATTLALGFASYQTLVRRTGIGRWLHGPRVATR
jgi:peptidoglycan/LPS O-acetylase OafA/YrhL